MKRFPFFLSLVLFGFVLGGCLPGGKTQTPPAEVTPVETASESADQEQKVYTLEEVALHNSAQDCWLAIEGNVYEVTSFVESQKHPGGEAILLGCGKDATELFNNRPNEKGAHSERARGFLPQYLIGVLANY